MVFSSHLFVFYFLPLTLAVYYLLPTRARHGALTLLSYLFYGWGNPAFMLLMFGSTVVDFLCGLWIVRRAGRDEQTGRRQLVAGTHRTGDQRFAVAVSVCTNLALLGFFKYFNFATDTYNAFVSAIGFPDLSLAGVLRITLPLGISFYTFQSMSYTIDVYRGHVAALRNPIDFACYVSLFPQLVAGPIIRFSEIADQLRGRTHSLEKFARGVALFSLGMTKKILLANPCGKIADTVFDAGSATAVDAWYGMVAYSFQIYFDFSGYTDMAIGLGLMLGFVFPKNFDSPYRAASLTEFWRRWHISLSRWLRDYLYIPLGGSRKGTRRTYINLFLVMLLGGLWHGAAWNFVFWGGLHGFGLAVERLRGGRGFGARLPRPLRVAVTFAFVTVLWVLFRAADLPAAIRYFGSLVGGSGGQETLLLGGLIYNPYYLLTFATCAIVAFGMPQSWDWTRRLNWWKALVSLALLALSLTLLSTQSYNPFIYFIF